MSENIESRVAKTVLQQSEEITIAGEVMEVAPPSSATLILVSEEAAKLPNVKLDSENIAGEVLYVAKDCRALGDIVAILILGAKNLVERKKVIKTTAKRRLFGLLKETHEEEIEITINHKAELSKKLLEDITPRELHNLTVRLLKALQIADFFGLTTSLIEVNLIRQTREVVSETTASGR
ncbi:MAG: hypothetical protein RSE25_05910 [Bacteroidales bacterium]